jgi:hypothetical protein
MNEHPTFVAYAESPSGLSSMLGDLIEQNLARDPSRRRLLKPSVYAIEATDAQIAVTLRVHRHGVRIEEGLDPTAVVRIRADSSALLSIPAAPLRLGFPDLASPQGRRVLGDILRGRVKISGLIRHPALVTRLTLLLSAR